MWAYDTTEIFQFASQIKTKYQVCKNYGWRNKTTKGWKVAQLVSAPA